MSELDAMIAGAVGGSMAALGMAFVLLGHIKWHFDQKIKDLQFQLIALRAELNAGYEK